MINRLMPINGRSKIRYITNKRLHKLVDCIDIKINEGIPIKYIQINNVEVDIVEDKEEKVQESEK